MKPVKKRQSTALPLRNGNMFATLGDGEMESDSDNERGDTTQTLTSVVNHATQPSPLRPTGDIRRLGVSAAQATSSSIAPAQQQQSTPAHLDARFTSSGDARSGKQWSAAPGQDRQRRSAFDSRSLPTNKLKPHLNKSWRAPSRQSGPEPENKVLAPSPAASDNNNTSPRVELNWRKTNANFKGSGTTANFRDLLTIDPKLKAHVGDETGWGKRSTIQGPSTKDGDSIDDILDGELLQHEGEHIFERGRAPRDQPNTRIEARPNNKEALIKTRIFVVLEKNGNKTKEVQICTFHDRGMAAVYEEKWYRHAHLRPPHIAEADFKVLSKKNPVFKIAKAYREFRFKETAVINVAEPIYRDLRENSVRVVGRLEAGSLEELKRVVDQRSKEYAAKR